MATFDSLLRKAAPASGSRRPPLVITLPVSAWASDREDRPTAPVQVGIRLLAEADIQAAKGEAARISAELVAGMADEDDRISAYNDALIRVAVARCACSPNDELVPYFTLAELEVRNRLTPEGVRVIWDAVSRLHVQSSPTVPEIDDEGFGHLIAMWGRGVAFEHMPPNEVAAVRRLLEYCRMQLDEAEQRAVAAGEAIIAG